MLALACACGRLGFDPISGNEDGGNAGDGTSAVVDAPPGSVTVTFGETGTATFSGVTADCTLDSQSTMQGNNFGGSPTLEIDASINGKGAVLRFDVSAIPTTATVFSATIELTTAADGSADEFALRFLKESEVWEEGTGNGTAGAANWLERQPGVAWLGEGADGFSHTGSIIGSIFPVAPNTKYAIPLDDGVAQRWVDRGFNNGVRIVDFGNDDVSFASSEAPELAARPLLTIVYVP
jgi:hypothetical protein